MKTFAVQDIKDFMTKLFLTDFFHPFFLVKGEVKTCAAFSIDGRRPGADAGYVGWEQVGPAVFQIIKGRKSPSLLFLVFEAKEAWIASRMDPEGLSFFINVRFEQKVVEGGTADCLLLTTGVSGGDFLRAHQLERAWEQMAEEYLRKAGICFTDGF